MQHVDKEGGEATHLLHMVLKPEHLALEGDDLGAYQGCRRAA